MILLHKKEKVNPKLARMFTYITDPQLQPCIGKETLLISGCKLSYIFMHGSCHSMASSWGQLVIYLSLYGNSLQQRHLRRYRRLPLQSPDRNGGSSGSRGCRTAHRKVHGCTHSLQQHYKYPTVTTLLTAPNSAAYVDGFICFKVLRVRYNYHDVLLGRGSGFVNKPCYFCKWTTTHQSYEFAHCWYTTVLQVLKYLGNTMLLK